MICPSRQRRVNLLGQNQLTERGFSKSVGERAVLNFNFNAPRKERVAVQFGMKCRSGALGLKPCGRCCCEDVGSARVQIGGCKVMLHRIKPERVMTWCEPKPAAPPSELENCAWRQVLACNLPLAHVAPRRRQKFGVRRARRHRRHCPHKARLAAPQSCGNPGALRSRWCGLTRGDKCKRS
jgi:hypothetical protein